MNDGADVLMQNTDSSAVLQAAEKAGKHGFGWDSDMSKYGPHAHLGSAVINWAPYYKKATKDVARRHLEDRADLVGRQGRGHRPGVRLGQRSGGREEEAGRGEGRA